jgi:cytoskeletal protein CcmA (bactofilin family)
MFFVMRRYLGLVALLGLMGGVAAAELPKDEEDFPPTCAKRANVYIAENETMNGNRYFVSGGFDLDGRMVGDLLTLSSYISMGRHGVLEGDILAWASNISLDGTVKGDVRVFAQKMSIRGIVEGDVLFFGQILVIEEGAEIQGELRSFSADSQLHGHVRGPVTAKGGMLKLDGTYDDNLDLEFDSIVLVPSTHVSGDLTYKARKIDVDKEDFEAAVDGTVTLQVKEDIPGDGENPDDKIGAWDVFWFMARFLWTFLLGLILFRLLGTRKTQLIESIGKEPLIVLLIGIAGVVMTPIASVILLITLPLGLIGFGSWLLLLYLAKLPVAFWAGGYLAGRMNKNWGPGLRLLIGLFPMYLLFLVPYLGVTLWWGVTFLGFGTIAYQLMRYASGSSSQTGAPAAS